MMLDNIKPKLTIAVIALFCSLNAQTVVPRDSGNPYSVPESPAFSYLGVSPQEIARPTTPQALAAALVNGIDTAGRVQQGVAIDIALLSAIPAIKVSLKDYQNKPLSFLAANMQLSFATIKTSGNQGSTDGSAGFRILFVDKSDPMQNMEFTNELRDSLKNISMPDQPNETNNSKDIITNVGALNGRLRAKWAKQHWNDYGLAFAAAVGGRLENSRLKNAKFIGAGTWVTASMPLSTNGQMVALLRYDWRNADLDSLRTSLFAYGIKGVVGQPLYTFYIEATGQHGFQKGSPDYGNRGKFIVGVERKIMDNLWLTLGVGDVVQFLENGTYTDGALLLSKLSVNILHAPRFSQ